MDISGLDFGGEWCDSRVPSFSESMIIVCIGILMHGRFAIYKAGGKNIAINMLKSSRGLIGVYAISNMAESNEVEDCTSPVETLKIQVYASCLALGNNLRPKETPRKSSQSVAE